MTKRAKARARSLDDALREAIAEIAGVDEGDVDLDLDVDDFDLGSITQVNVDLRVDLRAEDGDGDEDEDEDGGDGSGPDDELTIEDLDEEADAAADFVEGLLDAMGLPGDIQIRVREDHAEVEVVNVGSGQLIGRRGQTLDAVQELLRCAMQRRFERRCRVTVDVEGYRERRLEKLLEKAQEAIDEALETGEEQRLEPMDVHERKAVHRLVAEHDGVTSGSRGREPTRRVVIEPDA